MNDRWDLNDDSLDLSAFDESKVVRDDHGRFAEKDGNAAEALTRDGVDAFVDSVRHHYVGALTLMVGLQRNPKWNKGRTAVHIEWISVDKASRRQGIASAAIRKLQAFAARHDADVTLHPESKKLEAFYASLGFKPDLDRDPPPDTDLRYMRWEPTKRTDLSDFDESKVSRDERGRFAESGSAPRGVVKRAWHITSDPNFRPDPTYKPELNSIAGDLIDDKDKPAGLFVTDSPEYWMQAHGYERAYVAEVEGVVTNPPGTIMHRNREEFMQGDMKTVRVLPIDEYAREVFGGTGWVEDYHDAAREKAGNGYVGRSVAEMSPEEIDDWERKFTAWARRADGPNRVDMRFDPDQPRDENGRWADAGGEANELTQLIIGSGVASDHVRSLYSSDPEDALATDFDLDTVRSRDVEEAKAYIKAVSQDALRKKVGGDEFVGYRGLTGSEGKQPVTSLTLSKKTAEFHANGRGVVAYRLPVSEVLSYSEAIGKGTFAEEEIVVFADRLQRFKIDLKSDAIHLFNPDQPRDENGRWSETGSAGVPSVVVQRLASSPTFKAWFGKSTVVDDRGLPRVLYHSTTATFESFRPLTHFGTAEAANDRNETLDEFFKTIGREDRSTGSQVIPVVLRLENPLRMPDLAAIDSQSGQPLDEAIAEFESRYDEEERAHRDDVGEAPRAAAWESETDLQVWLYRNDIITSDEFWDVQYDVNKAVRLLEKKGYDGIVYNNAVEDAGNDSYIIFQPDQAKRVSDFRDYKLFDPDQPRDERGRWSSAGAAVEDAPAEDAQAVDVSASPVVKSPQFKRWFKESAVVDINGDPLVVYHGTTHNVTSFLPAGHSNLNPESDFGAGVYFTSSPEDASKNYAGIGPDLQQRIDLLVEELSNDAAFVALDGEPLRYTREPSDPGRRVEWAANDKLIDVARDKMSVDDIVAAATTAVDAEIATATVEDRQFWQAVRDNIESKVDSLKTVRQLAEEQIVGTAKAVVMPVYLSIQKPFVVGDANMTSPKLSETELSYDWEGSFDDDVDVDVPAKGTLPELMEALRLESSRHYDGDNAYMRFQERMVGMDALSAREFVDIWKESAVDVSDDNGRLVSSEVLRAALQRAGYDGVIDRSVDTKFGSGSRRVFPMEGMDPDTTHFVVFNPTQIKSALGNRAFDPNRPDVHLRHAYRMGWCQTCGVPRYDCAWNPDQPRDESGRWASSSDLPDGMSVEHREFASGNVGIYINDASLGNAPEEENIKAGVAGRIVVSKDGPRSLTRKYLVVEDVYLRASLRGKGLGKRLYQEAIAYAKSKGLRGIASGGPDARRNVVSDNVWERHRTGNVSVDGHTYDIMTEWRDAPEATNLFDPDQPRDEDGRWSAAGASGSSGEGAAAADDWSATKMPGRIQVEQTKTPEFKRWFSKSKVAKRGRPLVVYHGSPDRNIGVFDPVTAGLLDGARSDDPSSREVRESWIENNRANRLDAVGTWFTEELDVAEKFTARMDQKRGEVYAVWLSIQNPKEYTSWSALLKDFNDSVYGPWGPKALTPKPQFEPKGLAPDGAETFKMKLIREGYDGISVTEKKGIDFKDSKQRYWVALYPEQIKSATDNDGGFSSNKSNIRLSDHWEQQPRDENGQWASVGSGGPSGSRLAENAKIAAALRGSDSVDVSGQAMLASWDRFRDLAATHVATEPSQIKRLVNERVAAAAVERGVEAPVAKALTRKIIDGWANTSGDHNPDAILVQQAIAKEFGLEQDSSTAPALDHLPSVRIGSSDNHVVIGIVGPDGRVMAQREQVSFAGRPAATSVDESRRYFEQEQSAKQTVLRAMYQQTQDFFKQSGITHLTLYRGEQLDRAPRARRNSTVARLQPASSFSLDRETANEFAKGGLFGRVYEVKVPVERVLSTALTGAGAYGEAEVVLLGGPVRAKVSYVGLAGSDDDD